MYHLVVPVVRLHRNKPWPILFMLGLSLAVSLCLSAMFYVLVLCDVNRNCRADSAPSPHSVGGVVNWCNMTQMKRALGNPASVRELNKSLKKFKQRKAIWKLAKARMKQALCNSSHCEKN